MFEEKDDKERETLLEKEKRQREAWQKLQPYPLALNELFCLTNHNIAADVMIEIYLKIIAHPEVSREFLINLISPRAESERLRIAAAERLLALVGLDEAAPIVIRHVPAKRAEIVEAIMAQVNIDDPLLFLVVQYSEPRRVEAWKRLKDKHREDLLEFLIKTVWSHWSEAKKLALADLWLKRNKLAIGALRAVVLNTDDISWRIVSFNHPAATIDDACFVAGNSSFDEQDDDLKSRVKAKILGGRPSADQLLWLVSAWPDEVMPLFLARAAQEPVANYDYLLRCEPIRRFWPDITRITLKLQKIDWITFECMLTATPELQTEIEAHPDYAKARLIHELIH